MSRTSAVVLAIAAAATGPASTQHETRATAIREGEDLARIVCASCHSVAPGQPAAHVLNPPPPSLSDIANSPNTTAKSLRRFIETTHWDDETILMTMPEQGLIDDEATDVVSYILSLRKHD